MWGIDRLTRLLERTAAQLDAVLTELKQLPDKARFDALEARIIQMANTIADLDAALTAFETAQTAQQAEVQKAVNDILAKVGPGVDLSAEVARITAAQAKAQSAADAIAALDVQPTPTPAPTP